MLNSVLVDDAERLLATLRERRLRLATAESCTGGLIAGYLTEVPGSSDVVERGFITYSNEAKTQVLAVPAALIMAEGAVSQSVAQAMAAGAVAASHADLAVAVTGVAGPGGGSDRKPVGLVHIAVAMRTGDNRHRECRFGHLTRTLIREKTITEAFALIRQALG